MDNIIKQSAQRQLANNNSPEIVPGGITPSAAYKQSRRFAAGSVCTSMFESARSANDRSGIITATP
ncbi:MAG: hypothetical protein NVS4B8_01240 [Herpetosiphon sp.]